MDRRRIVERHQPELNKWDPWSPFSVGNGEFAFSADITGLQTFPEQYEVPLGTQSNWGWHYTGGHGRFTASDAAYQMLDTNGRPVGYPMKPGDKVEAYHWLRQNPHRLQLGRISFRILLESGAEAQAGDVTNIRQQMNLWTGILNSEFCVQDVPIRVMTASHPVSDVIGVRVESPLIRQGRLLVFIQFPAPDMTHTEWSKAVFPDWGHDDRHRTVLREAGDQRALLERSMDEDSYEVGWEWSAGRIERTGVHEFTLLPDTQSEVLEFSVGFAPRTPQTKPVDNIVAASRSHWERFWMSGAAIDFAGSADPRAYELERRVVLSQYLCAVHSGGSLPPQETGLMYNSWFGKSHLEMHWWHAAHFPLWGRESYLLKSMNWYCEILPIARDLAQSQGYEGARWPKMVGFDGQPCPSPVAPGLIWQQPHPMALAELCYQADPTRVTLERFRDLVFEAANFMVSYAHPDKEKCVYNLGPPLIPAQECHSMQDSINPPYELEYWKYGLEIAVRWAERLQVAANPLWAKVAQAMAEPPQADGVYLAHERCEDTFTAKNHDHPSMLGALGILPGTLIDRKVMLNTLLKVKDVWNWDSAWGWDFPMCAMTAARLGEPDLAVDFLLLDATKNTYLTNGHNYQRPGLSAYLPGNGGLLTAVAMMACGWNGSQQGYNPGFPQNGRWSVKWEGLKPWL
ncbi:glycoside hydrolase family 65 [Paenibacillus sp. FSL H7-0331]|uniref:glycoside hydrolase family 65 n=1 Tax=Paenibacillus sp. FSL H7-0331 TaxID=1920421 RepID=UPI00096DD966|nr:glycoside hydrolase family 65 [Paenibacillus sp. FSL H7-0331]OMF07438.1 glycoside hydrolase family 65 [Paenibacillus sp. FSL H7-0331]